MFRLRGRPKKPALLGAVRSLNRRLFLLPMRKHGGPQSLAPRIAIIGAVPTRIARDEGLGWAGRGPASCPPEDGSPGQSGDATLNQAHRHGRAATRREHRGPGLRLTQSLVGLVVRMNTLGLESRTTPRPKRPAGDAGKRQRSCCVLKESWGSGRRFYDQALRNRKCLPQIRDKVVGMFNPDAEPDQAVGDTDPRARLRRDAGVSC